MLPDDGSDLSLIRAMKERGVTVADSLPCRGVSVLREAKARNPDDLPESVFVRLVQMLVPEERADELFEYVYIAARMGRPHGGVAALSEPICVTPYRLPTGVPDEQE
jgi:hypothetical protein